MRPIKSHGWKPLHVEGIDGISCQHLQVMMTELLQKHWEWQEDKRNNVWFAQQQETPTMYIASMDSKTAFDAARPQHIAKIMGDQDVHGLITAAFSREMRGLEGHAAFEHVEIRFKCTRCIRQVSVEAPTLWLKLAMHFFWNVEKERLVEEKDGSSY